MSAFLTTKLLKVSCSICSGDALICSAPYQGQAALNSTESEHTTGSTAVTIASCSSQSCCDLTAWLTLVMGNVPKRQCFVPVTFCCVPEWLLEKHWCTCCPNSTCCLHGSNGTSSAYTTFHINALQS